MGVKLGNGKWAIKEDKLLAYNDNSGRFFNKEFDFSRGSSATYVAKDGLIKTAGLQETNLVNNGDFSELGNEILPQPVDLTVNFNGNSGGIVVDANTFETFGGGLDGIKATILEVGKSYKLTIEGNTTSLGFTLGNQELSGNEYGIGFGTHYFKATGTRLWIRQTQAGITNITSFSIKQVDPNDYWTLGTGWSFGDNKAVFTSGTSGILFQSNIVETGKLYKLTFDVIRTSGFITSVFLGGVSDSTDINESGSYTYYITSINQDVLGFNADSTFNGSITNISVQEIQTDTPRIDFSDSVKGALLLEPQSTNLVAYSNLNFGTSSVPDGWIVGFGTGTYSHTPTTYKGQPAVIHRQETTGRSYLRVLFTGTNAEHTIRVEFDKSRCLNMEDSDPIIATIGVTNFEVKFWSDVDANGVLEFQTTFGADASGELIIGLGVIGNEGVNKTLVWGMPQIELGSYATSYIPTFGSVATRLADVCNNSGSAQDFNSEEGVIYMEVNALANDGTIRYFGLSDGSSSNRALFLFDSTENRIRAIVSSGGTKYVDFNYDVTDITEFHKIALKIQRK